MIIDANILSTALDAWERDPSSYDITPFHAFSVAQPAESSYLWQLSRGAGVPPNELVDQALLNLVAWGLIDERGALTSLGRRLMESRSGASSRNKSSSAPRSSAPARAPSERVRLAGIGAMSRLSDRALHLLREIAAGRDRIFVMDERPPGWAHIERLGLATSDSGDRARLTAVGEEFVLGLESGQREALEDAWTPAHARAYFAEIGRPTSLYDAGHQAGVRAATGLNRSARRYAHTDPRASKRARLPLTPAKVIADLKKTTGVPASVLTRRTKRSGLTVRKHNRSFVFVSYDDFGDRRDQPKLWPKIVGALEEAGYTLHMLGGLSGEEAKKMALVSGAVLVTREPA
jgi:hypothetical protein